MNRADLDAESGDGPVSTARESLSGRRSVSKATSTARRALRSGTGAGAIGGVLLFRGIRSLRRGARGRGVGQLLLGGLLVALARRQRRSGDGERSAVDQTDVVDTGPEVGEAGTGSAADSDPAASGDEAEAVVDTGPDVEDAGSGPELDDDTESMPDDDTESMPDDDTETMPIDETDVGDTGVEDELDDVEREPDGSGYGGPERLGEAAFDEESGRVPAPQRAFDLNLLPLGGEVSWGVREGDPGVFVSGNYDALEERDDVRYVASSETDDDRGLVVPDPVRDHWDDVAGGGTAVTAGDGIVFATTDELQVDGQVLVVPEQWSDDVLDGEE